MSESDQPSRRDLLRAAAGAATAAALQGCRATVPAAREPASPAPPFEAAVPPPPAGRGFEIRGPRIFRDGRPFLVSGFNYWAPLPALMQDLDGRGWDRVRRDLDGLQDAGVNLLRIMAATEGPDTEPLRIVPALQKAPRAYDQRGVELLQALVEELDRRKLPAILVLNDFWHWSGGMAQYVAWSGRAPIPYPPPYPRGSWSKFQLYASRFYSDESALSTYYDWLRFIVPKLKQSPSVIWELANEPRGINSVAAFHRWIDESAGLIKSLAPGQLVTTGCEGQTDSPYFAGLDTVEDHRSPHIDFITVHMWAQNWGWVRGDKLTATLPGAIERARRYVAEHAKLAATLGKPAILEEFGFPRDDGSFSPDAPVTLRDRYFAATCDAVAATMESSPMAGLMPWAWSGDTRPARPGEMWKPGDPFTGDPPHEKQGWYSIYPHDSTMRLVREWSARVAAMAARLKT